MFLVCLLNSEHKQAHRMFHSVRQIWLYGSILYAKYGYPYTVNSIHGRLTPAQKVKPNMAATPGRHSQSPMQTDTRGQLRAGIFKF